MKSENLLTEKEVKRTKDIIDYYNALRTDVRRSKELSENSEEIQVINVVGDIRKAAVNYNNGDPSISREMREKILIASRKFSKELHEIYSEELKEVEKKVLDL